MDKGQLMPVSIAGGQLQATTDKISAGVSRYFWLLMVLVFLVERWLAHKSQFKS
jgi:hypothetical protein